MKRATGPAAVLAMALTAGCNFTQPPPGNAADERPAPAAEPAPFRLRTLIVTERSLTITPDLAADLIIVQREAQIVLPPIADVPQGRAFVIRAVELAAIRPSGSDRIEGSRAVGLEAGESRMFVAAGNGSWLALLDGDLR
ncbi:MAG: hypothetical protein E6G92_03985 [Alphaproteobacteria bacterium]|nr:MAG: hypothetical protein E6G92_03985 [Alphaproteobacteria bacterium]